MSLVGNVVYFDAAAITGPLTVLAGWGLFGLALELTAQVRTRLSFARLEPVPRLTLSELRPGRQCVRPGRIRSGAGIEPTNRRAATACRF